MHRHHEHTARRYTKHSHNALASVVSCVSRCSDRHIKESETLAQCILSLVNFVSGTLGAPHCVFFVVVFRAATNPTIVPPQGHAPRCSGTAPRRAADATLHAMLCTSFGEVRTMLSCRCLPSDCPGGLAHDCLQSCTSRVPSATSMRCNREPSTLSETPSLCELSAGPA